MKLSTFSKLIASIASAMVLSACFTMPAGPAGPQGETGATGATGSTGYTGRTGATGEEVPPDTRVRKVGPVQ